METILILTTGGTIDKVYFDARSTYEVGPPNIARLLDELNPAITYRIEDLMRKDSLDLTDIDRDIILQAAERALEKRILITHGTDTMVQTGRQLTAISGKTIVLTGALQPALFKTSDALFNIGAGLAAVQILAPGVYIAMNGTIFNVLNVTKNLQNNRFERLSHDQ